MNKPRTSLDVNRTQLIGMIAALRGILIEFTNPEGLLKQRFSSLKNDREQEEDLAEVVRQGRELMELTGFALDPAEEVNGGFDKSWHFEDSPETMPDDLAAARKRIAELEQEIEADRDLLADRFKRIQTLASAERVWDDGYRAGMALELPSPPSDGLHKVWWWRGYHSAQNVHQLGDARNDGWRSRMALIMLRNKARDIAEVLRKGGAIDPAEMVQQLVITSTADLVAAYEAAQNPSQELHGACPT